MGWTGRHCHVGITGYNYGAISSLVLTHNTNPFLLVLRHSALSRHESNFCEGFLERPGLAASSRHAKPPQVTAAFDSSLILRHGKDSNPANPCLAVFIVKACMCILRHCKDSTLPILCLAVFIVTGCTSPLGHGSIPTPKQGQRFVFEVSWRHVLSA
jgi:hypothetical protein